MTYAEITGWGKCLNIANIGNTSAASIPIALCDAIEAGRLQADATLLCPAFGAGLSSAAAVIQWSHRTTGLGTSKRELPACERSVA